MKKFCSLPILFSLYFFVAQAQNLIVNPSAESVPTSNGWTATQTIGSSCFTGSGWRVPGNQNGFPAAQSGSYLFFPGCGGATGSGKKYELYQDINVSSNAAAIDAGKYTITFSGYMRSYNQSTPDATEIILEFRNASNTVIATYTTGAATNTSGWVQYNHTRTAPAGTRTIRIRLIGTSYNGDSVDSYFDNLSLTGVSTLPVTLLSFTANAAAQESRLQWQTANEINNKGFYIERSSNGIAWETVGFVAAGTGSNDYEYHFTDKAPQTGVNYYRLKQVDIDGKYEYSPVRNVQHAYSARTVLFPNPASDLLSVLTAKNKFTAQIINPGGKVVATYINQKNMEIRLLPPGIYYLRILYDNNKIENFKFLKR